MSGLTASQCGSRARLLVLTALSRFGGAATYDALRSATGLSDAELDNALKGLLGDHWLRIDRSVARAKGGLWRLDRDRRRAAALMESA